MQHKKANKEKQEAKRKSEKSQEVDAKAKNSRDLIEGNKTQRSKMLYNAAALGLVA